MGEQTKIEWTDATFNPWVGCTKISPACDHCYAEGWAKRAGNPELWRGERRRTSAVNWRMPVKLNAFASAQGRRIRVFCASMADVFDNQVPPEWRADLWALIRATPMLDWQLLTKRPQNIAKMLPEDWGRGWPNVWLGTTVENQAEAKRRIPHLLATPAAVRFLSCEPLLGPVFPITIEIANAARALGAPVGECVQLLHWVIAGGESGPGARPMHPDWARSLRDQCAVAGVPFHFKQWGEWAPVCEMSEELIDAIYHPAPERSPEAIRRCKVSSCVLHATGDRFDGAAMFQRPAFEQGSRAMTMFSIGKARAGRLLDGRTHDQFPGSAA